MGTKNQIYPQHLADQARRLSEEGAPIAAIARTLGVSAAVVRYWHNNDWRVRRRWTTADDESLVRWRRQGGTLQGYQDRYRWSHNTVIRHARRLGVHGWVYRGLRDDLESAIISGRDTMVLHGKHVRLSTIRAINGRANILRDKWVFSARQVASLLGLPCHKRVTRWIKRGLLMARRSSYPVQQPRGVWYRITYDDLLNALRNEATWPDWRVEDITDPDWRYAAGRVRQGEW